MYLFSINFIIINITFCEKEIKNCLNEKEILLLETIVIFF